MRHTLSLGLAVLLIVARSCAGDPKLNDNPKTHPPFDGTIFLDPDIVTEEDPSSFESITSKGQDTRNVLIAGLSMIPALYKIRAAFLAGADGRHTLTYFEKQFDFYFFPAYFNCTTFVIGRNNPILQTFLNIF